MPPDRVTRRARTAGRAGEAAVTPGEAAVAPGEGRARRPTMRP